MIRDDIKTALVSAMKSGDKESTSTIRLIQSAIKNRDIELRTASSTPDDDALGGPAYSRGAEDDEHPAPVTHATSPIERRTRGIRHMSSSVAASAAA